MTSMNSAERTSTSSTDLPTNILVLSNVFYPVIEQLNLSKDLQSELRQSFYQLEETYPGFSRRFLQTFLEKEFPSFKSNVDLDELTLKIEKFCDKTPYIISTSKRNEAEFEELNIRSKHLKIILSRIPDVIHDKRPFLETIKEIASAIKRTLDSFSSIYQYFTSQETHQAFDIEKKEFIRSSRNFSDTLKAFFSDNQRDEVFRAANHLLVRTDYLLRTIRLFSESKSLDESFYPLRSLYQQQWKQTHSNRSSVSSNSTGDFLKPSSNPRVSSTHHLNYS